MKKPQLSILAAVVTVLSVGLTWGISRQLASYRSAWTSSSTVDLSNLMAIQVRSEMTRITSRLQELAEKKPPFELSPADWDMLTLAVWNRAEAGAPIERGPVMAQSAHLNSNQVGYLNSKTEEEIERKLIISAFQGTTYVTNELNLEPIKAIWIAVPVGRGKIQKVVSAHFKMDRFLRSFRSQTHAELMLINQDGTVLAHRDTERVGTTEPELSRKVYGNGESADPSGEARFVGANGKPYLGGFSRVMYGNWVVVAAIAEEELALSSSEKGILLVLSAILLASTGAAFFFGRIVYRRRRRGKNAAKQSQSAESTASEASPVSSDEESPLGINEDELPPLVPFFSSKGGEVSGTEGGLSDLPSAEPAMTQISLSETEAGEPLVLMHAAPKPAPESTTPAADKFWVNNGSQIIGPLTSKEIGQRLYCQELDFDCECWVDGEGNRMTIAESGMFGGTFDAEARFWVFDRETIHGPMTEGFLHTAMKHGAMNPDYPYCVGTTLNGWSSLSSLVSSPLTMDQSDRKAA